MIEYIIIFLEGIITFISPCVLPMIPVYFTYLGVKADSKGKFKSFINVVLFIFGFTTIFVITSIFASTVGFFVKKYRSIVRIIFGIIIFCFGIYQLGIFAIFIKSNKTKIRINVRQNILSSYIMGIIFAITCSPCVGIYLGSALLIIATKANLLKGILQIIIYCLGFGIPFLISSLLFDELKAIFGTVKKNYKILSKIFGIFLCLIGVGMCFGIIG